MTPERTHTCGLCGAFTTILGSAGETWNSYQAPAMAAWETQHCRQVHPDHEGDVVMETYPNPMSDR